MCNEVIPLLFIRRATCCRACAAARFMYNIIIAALEFVQRLQLPYITRGGQSVNSCLTTPKRSFKQSFRPNDRRNPALRPIRTTYIVRTGRVGIC